MDLKKIKEELLKREDYLSIYATKSTESIRLNDEKEDIRTPFFHDIDRVIHSMSFTRYTGKTQVFSFNNNDHVSMRMVHVQLVSKIARTIGRMLNLNEDLIEAIGLGHDIGHAPLGHTGEHILNSIAKKELNETFLHNIQSVRVYMALEHNGLGNNLSIQVLDGVMCHNGESIEQIYKPKKKTKEEFFNDYYKSLKSKKYASTLVPMTLEGCVVRISDVIAYLGRDIEDAIRIGKLDINVLPESITKVLGNNNSDIVNNIVIDIVQNSYNKPYIKMSDKVFKAINELKDFNYKYIYNYANSKKDIEFYEQAFNTLYNTYIKDLECNRNNSAINEIFLKEMDNNYIKNTKKERIVIDFLAGMTDDFFLSEYKKIVK